MAELLPDWRDMPEADREARVRELILEGRSASIIARHFRRCTRSAVIGFCNRREIPMANKSGWSKEAGEKGRAASSYKAALKAKVKAPPKPKASKPAKPPKITPPPFETAPLPEEELGNDVGHLIGIMDLKADSCRYMYGDPKGQHGYCGQTTKANSSWCPHHHDVVFGGRP